MLPVSRSGRLHGSDNRGGMELAEEQDQSTTIQIDYAPNKDTVKIHFADLPRAIDVLEKMAQNMKSQLLTTFKTQSC